MSTIFNDPEYQRRLAMEASGQYYWQWADGYGNILLPKDNHQQCFSGVISNPQITCYQPTQPTRFSNIDCKEMPQTKICPDCNGSKEYIGLFEKDKCIRCGGSGSI